MKYVVLSADTAINGVIRRKGEHVLVPSGWSKNVKRVVSGLDTTKVEEKIAREIEQIEQRDEAQKTKPIMVQVKINGNGTLKLEPEQKEYFLDDVLVLTATPGKGEVFQAYNIIYSFDKEALKENPTKLSLRGDVVIEVLFVQEGDVIILPSPIELPVGKDESTPVK